MPDSLFITGASGLVGSRLLLALDPGRYSAIHLLSRRPLRLPASLRHAPNVTVVRGDLLAPDGWAGLLQEDTTVVHAAAATGSVGSERLHAVNVTGLARLLRSCEEARVRRLLHLSSIAVCYPNLADYPYARSKREAERLVRASALDYTIVRPTVLIDAAAPAFANLVRLAAGPVLMVPGDGRARLQPLALDDLVGILLRILETVRPARETLDLGGPETLPVEDLLRRIRRRLRGSEGPTLHLPMALLLPALRSLAHHWPGTPPVSPGQLSVFRFDGVGATPEPLATLAPECLPVDEMLAQALQRDPATERLERECEVFSRYLLGQPPDPELRAGYLDAGSRDPFTCAPTAFDHLLLRLAATHPVATRAVDVYARFFRPTARIRKKLILTLAIAETDASSYAEIDRADADGALRFLLRSLGRGLTSGLLLFLAALLLLPAQLLLADRLTDRKAGGS